MGGCGDCESAYQFVCLLGKSWREELWWEVEILQKGHLERQGGGGSRVVQFCETKEALVLLPYIFYLLLCAREGLRQDSRG